MKRKDKGLSARVQDGWGTKGSRKERQKKGYRRSQVSDTLGLLEFLLWEREVFCEEDSKTVSTNKGDSQNFSNGQILKLKRFIKITKLNTHENYWSETQMKNACRDDAHYI